MSDKIEKICNLVDDESELIDPNPDIHQLFILYDHQFFSGVLSSHACTIEWSKRMTSCAGICVMNSSDGNCCIRISEPLLKLRKRKDLVETLLHEMIHGYLFLTRGTNFIDRDGHGPEFQSHMNRINAMAGTSISIYHTFHAEVRHYKKHWWRCTGPCRLLAPYYGLVKRPMNRAPGPHDYWWKRHKQTCNGNFIKVKEPEMSSKSSTNNKKSKQSSKSNINSASSTSTAIGSFGSNKRNIDPQQSKIDEFFSAGTSQQSEYNDRIQQNEISKFAVQPRHELQKIDNNKLFPGKGYRLDVK